MAGKTRRATFQDPGGDLFAKYAGIKNRAERCIRFIEAECMVPEGRGTGKPYRLRPYQKRTIRRLLAPGVLVAVLSAPRGWTKSGLAAAIAVWALYDREAAQVLIYSYRLGLALMELGHHNNGLHQSPQSYDAESGMACPITQCLMTFVKWRLSAAHGTPHEMAYEAPRTAQDAR